MKNLLIIGLLFGVISLSNESVQAIRLGEEPAAAPAPAEEKKDAAPAEEKKAAPAEEKKDAPKAEEAKKEGAAEEKKEGAAEEKKDGAAKEKKGEDKKEDAKEEKAVVKDEGPKWPFVHSGGEKFITDMPEYLIDEHGGSSSMTIARMVAKRDVNKPGGKKHKKPGDTDAAIVKDVLGDMEGEDDENAKPGKLEG